MTETQQIAGRGLGLLPAFDPRRSRYRLGDHLSDLTLGQQVPPFNVLEHGKILDQLKTGTCVGHTWIEWENCTPKGKRYQQGHQKALEFYDRATLLDPWPDNDLDRQAGTSTQAGAQVAVEWGLGQTYLWASTVEEVDAFIGFGEGPVVMGTYWYWSMDDTDANGFVRVEPRSGIAGGHEWLAFGVIEWNGMKVYVCQQSWGLGFGNEGIFYLSEEDFNWLFYTGEACTMIQTGVLPR